jgi:hypothetical protein
MTHHYVVTVRQAQFSLFAERRERDGLGQRFYDRNHAMVAYLPWNAKVRIAARFRSRVNSPKIDAPRPALFPRRLDE